MALRLRGVAYEEEATAGGGSEDAEEEGGLRFSTLVLLRGFITRPLVSPLSILLRSIAVSLAGTYVVVFIGTRYGHGAYVWVLVATGIGATVGPQLARAGRNVAGGPSLWPAARLQVYSPCCSPPCSCPRGAFSRAPPAWSSRRPACGAWAAH
ncbi:hypothetical protein BW737_000695 [Actinomyces ruminis]|uniref:Uncharacterized protein n=1 Tax=Actinomyces ruminis TaxID=1937003 RepID=A0ABX4ME12_9ACTO|nr:hypothetical protein BW737_000695 [Actinomyces ruminis]